jgi:shikimate kinase
MNDSSKNIVLIGMAGVGKTTVGRVLSKKIQRKFLDIDQEFEDQTKIRITDFFAIYGEKEFRKIERRIINDVLTKNKKLVVSAGGGIFSNDEIRDLIIKKSITFFLDSSIETLAERLKKNFSNRPLLNKGNLRDNIEKLYQKRIKDYMMAKHIILVDDLSVEDVVLNIIKRI